MSISPVVRAPLSLEVAGRLRAAILDGSIPAGSELPTEAELARSFGVGRSTVREALRVLQASGLVSGADTVSTARPRVTHERAADGAGVALSTAVLAGAIPLGDLVALRVLVEAESVRHVTSIPPEIHALLDSMDEAAARGDHVAFQEADVDFHVRLAHAGGNKAMGLVIAVLRDAISGYLLDALEQHTDRTAVLASLAAEHRAIVAAAACGDPDLAAALITSHVTGFYAERQDS
ncbi:MAG: FCD domain-containing protein [Nocardioides sp.]